MEGEAGNLHDDWELLHHSADSAVEAHPGLDGMAEVDSEGTIRDDYFSTAGPELYAEPLSASEDPTGLADPDNPSSVDPGCNYQFAGRNHEELRSDSSGGLSDERKFSDFSPAEEKRDSGGSVGLGTKDGDVGFGFDRAKFSDLDVKNEIIGGGFEDLGEIGESNLDSSSNQLCSGSIRDELDAEKLEADGSRTQKKDPRNEAESGAIEKVKAVEDERRKVVWWKVPFEVLRYCVLRVGPGWSFSVTAVVVGLVILGRRLHKMKQKSRNLQLKVALDDKKVSQFMSRAVRLNEAFSVVSRAPVVRPALAAAGVAPS